MGLGAVCRDLNIYPNKISIMKEYWRLSKDIFLDDFILVDKMMDVRLGFIRHYRTLGVTFLLDLPYPGNYYKMTYGHRGDEGRLLCVHFNMSMAEIAEAEKLGYLKIED